MVRLFFLSVLLICGSAFAGVQIQSSQNIVSASEKISYTFALIDDKTKALISDKDLMETHTKILHLVVYDASLNQFNHVHPTYSGNWNVELNLPVNGSYKVWAQGKTLDGNEFSVNISLVVENGFAEIPVAPLGDERVGTDGTTQVELANTKLLAGNMTMIDFMVTRTDGSTPNLSSYLGAFAHVIATQLNGNDLIHVHPMEGDQPNMGKLHATFPLAGEYRLWVQFIDDGVLKIIPLSVVVK